jgi:aspartyl-tRNA(Asn)/glutamyl-tRNA(Gln) amidotransferase subunit C
VDALNRLAAQMEAIVGYMDILNRVDTTGVDPLYSPLRDTAPPRPDSAAKTRSVEEILANAPQRQGRFFAVPPVL